MEQYEEPDDLFTGMKQVLVPADGGKRLLNYLIDQVASLGFATFVLVVANAIGGEAVMAFLKNIEANLLLNYLTSQLLYAVFMGGQEALLGGKSFGKMVTGTRALRRDGSRLTAEAAFTRGICRAIPLNTISALFSAPPFPWHDQLSRTIVIDERASDYQR